MTTLTADKLTHHVYSDWHIGVNDPTVLGWIATIEYFWVCLLCMQASRFTGLSERRITTAWGIVAILILFLGVNKQLDLQTLLKIASKRIVVSWGWYEERRSLEIIFLIVFATALLSFFSYFGCKSGAFFRQNPLMLVGSLLLLLFVLVRACSAEHVDTLFGVNLYRPKWRWLLELGGLACIGLAAVCATREYPKRRASAGPV